MWLQLVFQIKHNISLGQVDSQTSENVKTSERSGMETDQAEQLYVLLNQSAKILNKNLDAEKRQIFQQHQREIISLLTYWIIRILKLLLWWLKRKILISHQESIDLIQM